MYDAIRENKITSTSGMQTNVSGIIAEFTCAMKAAGIVVNRPLRLDGNLHRLSVLGDRQGAKSGAYKLHLDEMPVGYIKNWKTDYEVTWRPDCVPPLSATARQQANRAIRARAIRDEKVREDRQKQVATEAQALIANSLPATSHPYLAIKGVCAHGLFLFDNSDLLIPLQTIDGTIWNCQRISFNAANNQSQKTYMRGAMAKATFHPIGPIDTDEPLIIVEGYATGASIHEATQLPAVVACHSGNLLLVTLALRKKYPFRLMLIAGDNDHQLPRRKIPLQNIGIVKAEEAAAASNALTIFPNFESSSDGTDWNDFCQIHGRQTVQHLFERKVTAAI
jgi:phage/plasmid primase-like uncharacterized protein